VFADSSLHRLILHRRSSLWNPRYGPSWRWHYLRTWEPGACLLPMCHRFRPVFYQVPLLIDYQYSYRDMALRSPRKFCVDFRCLFGSQKKGFHPDIRNEYRHPLRRRISRRHLDSFPYNPPDGPPYPLPLWAKHLSPGVQIGLGTS
jgi:hypothetical protein